MFFFPPKQTLVYYQKGCYLCTVCTLGNIIDFIMNKQLGFPSCLEAMRKVVCVHSIIRDIILSKVSFDNKSHIPKHTDGKKSALFVAFTHTRVTFAEIVLLMNFMYLHSPHHTPKRVYKFIIRSITVYFLDTAFDAN